MSSLDSAMLMIRLESPGGVRFSKNHCDALLEEIERLRRRWDQITGDPVGSRHLLRLLMAGGTPDDFDTMIDRIINSKSGGDND